MSTRNRPKSPYNGNNPVCLRKRNDKAAVYTISLDDIPSLPDHLANRMGDGVRLTRAERDEADQTIAAAMEAIRRKRYGEAATNDRPLDEFGGDEFDE